MYYFVTCLFFLYRSSNPLSRIQPCCSVKWYFPYFPCYVVFYYVKILSYLNQSFINNHLCYFKLRVIQCFSCNILSNPLSMIACFSDKGENGEGKHNLLSIIQLVEMGFNPAVTPQSMFFISPPCPCNKRYQITLR